MGGRHNYMALGADNPNRPNFVGDERLILALAKAGTGPSLLLLDVRGVHSASWTPQYFFPLPD
jgi:hypothetical protein